MTNDIYRKNGYINRDSYLSSLAEDYGLPLTLILEVSDLLGPSEDFDGLVSTISEESLSPRWL